MAPPPLNRLLLLLPVILSSFPCPYHSQALADSGADSSSGRSSGPGIEWQILTERNFSSQIRTHPQILLMVTVPWSGEARSLMKELSSLVVDEDKFDILKLMVVYKSSEKMLADLLGAAEEIALFYYHNSVSHKYHGRLRAHNILASVRYFQSLNADEVPLKPLKTQEDIENFFQSTDKAVLLLEFCGWSAKLLRRKNNGNYEPPMSSYNHSENVHMYQQSIPGELVEDFHMENNEGMEDKFTYGVEEGLGKSAWPEYALANQSVQVQSENGGAGSVLTCTYEEFKQFESFLTKFTSVAREYFLPPERQRYGLISDNAMLSFLGITSPNKWLVMLHFSGCPNCTTIVQEDDLRNILQTQQSLVIELDADGLNLESAFPANKPSMVLFIDRSSDSLKVREDSKSSLEFLRKFASNNQLSYRTAEKEDNKNVEHFSEKTFSRAWSRSIPSSSGHLTGKVSQTRTIVKMQDNMVFMIINQGESISLRNTGIEDQDNNVYDTVMSLLQQENPASSTKETKISEVAKKAGFELLSDDFEVQIIDSLKSHNENDKSSQTDTYTILNEPEVLSESGDVCNSGLLSTTENNITEEGPEPDNSDIVANHFEPQEPVLYTEDDNEELKTGTCDSKEPLLSERNGICEQGGMAFSGKDEYSASWKQKLPDPEENLEDEIANKTDCTSSTTCSHQVKSEQSAIIHNSSIVFAGDDIAGIGTSMELKMTNEFNYQHHPFLGSFYFVDGNYQMLQTLTARSRIPSLVILDPILEQHFVFPKDMDISYLSLVSFVDQFLNGTLTPYVLSASSPQTSRQMPKPPFVNLDFHEADFIPQVASSTFCEKVMGFRPCEVSGRVPSTNPEDFVSAWKNDVLVLFSNPWCGFCQRMELVVREVHRAFKNFVNFSGQSKTGDPIQIKVEEEDFLLNKFPSIYLMDCTLNDCSLFLRPLGKKENYPVLLLFPAENKSAITYEGDMFVVSIMEFLESQGRNSPYLNKHKGILWTHLRKGRKDEKKSHSFPSKVREEPYSDDDKDPHFIADETISTGSQAPLESERQVNSHDQYGHVVIGYVLAATDKLLNTVPFDNSTVLIVTVDHNQGFQGVIINKRISWDIFKELDNDLLPLKEAPLFYGGPVSIQNFPLVSLAPRAKAGFTKITNGVYFGNSVATRQVIEEIKSREESADDYWFFLGFSSWAYEQLFEELAAGAWTLSRHPIKHLSWPEK